MYQCYGITAKRLVQHHEVPPNKFSFFRPWLPKTHEVPPNAMKVTNVQIIIIILTGLGQSCPEISRGG